MLPFRFSMRWTTCLVYSIGRVFCVLRRRDRMLNDVWTTFARNGNGLYLRCKTLGYSSVLKILLFYRQRKTPGKHHPSRCIDRWWSTHRKLDLVTVLLESDQTLVLSRTVLLHSTYRSKLHQHSVSSIKLSTEGAVKRLTDIPWTRERCFRKTNESHLIQANTGAFISWSFICHWHVWWCLGGEGRSIPSLPGRCAEVSWVLLPLPQFPREKLLGARETALRCSVDYPNSIFSY